MYARREGDESILDNMSGRLTEAQRSRHVQLRRRGRIGVNIRVSVPPTAANLPCLRIACPVCRFPAATTTLFYSAR